MALLSPSERAKWLSGLTDRQAHEIQYDWHWNARPNQLLPGTPRARETRTDWMFWLALAGRGWGKTRVGAESVREWARNPRERILMIAPTVADIRDVMIEGPSGLMACYPQGSRPTYLPTRRLVIFPSGAIGIMRSADEPERLRGPQFTKFWFDELAAAQYPQEAWDQIQFGFRLKTENLRGLITTTPKPLPIVKALAKNPLTVVTRGSSYENQSNLSGQYYRTVIAPYEGTRLGRQEIYAEILDDVPGALWTRALIDATRIHQMTDVRWDSIIRIVIAIDPAVTSNPESDETGILVMGITASGHIIVLADLSCRESPAGWARVAIAAFRSYRADRIVAEVNNGGDLVARNIYATDPNIPFRAVRASRGKLTRAEPASALYERGMVHHVGAFPALEDQMCGWTPQSGEKSPDRLDALVWGAYDLVIDPAEIEYPMTITAPVSISLI